MKKLILILLFLWVISSSLFAQTATNKIQNMATIFATNSPVTIKGLLSTESNVFIGGFISAGTNAVAGSSFIHSMVVSNAGNPTLALRNYDPTGTPNILFRTSGGTDAATMGTERNGSNIIIHAHLNALSYIRLTTQSGSSANEMFIHPGVTTNAGPFWARSINSTNYMVNGVRGLTLSVTNVGVGFTNVEVFAEGLLTNKFTIP